MNISQLKTIIILLSLLATSLNLNANPIKKMNGITFQQFKGFEHKWKLVTVRYRRDNQELRYVYANKKAHIAILQNKLPYPDGAVFAKVAYLAQPDPAFESSLFPSQTRRFQFMVKNSKKYKETNGWGYALFNQQGEIHPEPEKDQVIACHSCHQIVPERDYVFSASLSEALKKTKRGKIFEWEIEEILYEKIPSLVRQQLPESFKSLLQVKSPLTKNVFQGTLDEIKPSLAKIVVTQKKAVLFISDDMKRFTLIYPEDLKIECDDEGAKGLFLVSINSLLENKTNKVHFCQAY